MFNYKINNCKYNIDSNNNSTEENRMWIIIVAIILLKEYINICCFSFELRARITSEEVNRLPNILQMVADWIVADGSFLSAYGGRMRLWIDPNIPLRIPSFFEPEPGNSKEVE